MPYENVNSYPEALIELQSKPKDERRIEPRDILVPGTLLAYRSLAGIAKVVMNGMLSEQTLIERGLRKPTAGEGLGKWVFLAQVTQQTLEPSRLHPLTFAHNTVIDNYSSAYIDSLGLLSKVGLVVDPSNLDLETFSQRVAVDHERDSGQQYTGWIAKKDSYEELTTPHVPPQNLTGIVLVDTLGRVSDLDGRTVSSTDILRTRENTVEWLSKNVLPWFNVPLYSQSSGQVIK